MKRINVLSPLLSARIAAGEVIERPQSVLREFLDNAIDSGANEIKVTVDGGGIDLVKVQDNGNGISREDLELIGQRHATSKIKDADDLYTINTMGFRGEALYSISSVSKLTIRTKSKDSGEESELVIDNGKRYGIKDVGQSVGTVVSAEDLFKDIPARRAFLKRNATEAQLCRNLLTIKALAFPHIRFTLQIDGALRMDWPAVGSLKERVMMYYRQLGYIEGDFTEMHKSEDDFSISIIAGNSSVKRSDRKEIRVFVNNRPVEEYSLVQAVIYGYGELMPGGSYPVAALFINDKSELVDFNIHPAKKEVKIRNIAEIHHAVSALIRNNAERKIPTLEPVQSEFYLDNSVKETFSGYIKKEEKASSYEKPYKSEVPENQNIYLEERKSEYKPKDKGWIEKAKKLRESYEAKTAPKQQKEIDAPADEELSFRYIGQAFKLFLIAEYGNDLYLVDQHAAHERIIYNELLEQKSVQPLLVPLKLSVDNETDSFLENHSHVYTTLGIMLSKVSDGEWEVNALPAVCRGIETQIADFITSAKADEEELETKLFAIIACKAAIKAGDEIDRWSAEALLEKVWKLKEPACPHGRTFLIKVSEERLRELVGRTR